MSEQQTDLKEFWAQVIEKDKEGDINVSLWEALEAGVPLIIEDDRLVIGFTPANMKHSGYLTNPANAGTVRRAVEAVAGKRLQIELIEGDTIASWEGVKERAAAAADHTEQTAQVSIQHKGAAARWQELAQQIRQLYYDIGGREQPLSHARFLIKAIPLIAETEDEMRAEDPQGEELHERELDRIFDRIASLCGMPGGLVALEYLRYKGSRKKA